MNKMKRILSLIMVFFFSGCAVQKHCFIMPPLNTEHIVATGDRLVEKIECYGRVTVNDCSSGLWLVFLGKVGGNIRIQSIIGTATGVKTTEGISVTGGGGERWIGTWSSSSVSKTPIITEILYPESSKFIEFQDLKIEVIEVTENRITFKLVRISTQGCNKVNGQEEPRLEPKPTSSKTERPVLEKQPEQGVKQDTVSDDWVYVNSYGSGRYYHHFPCPTIKGQTQALYRPMKVKDAIEKGFIPCPYCNK